MGQLIFKKAIPHLIAIVAILLINIAYFYPQLEGKVVQSGDIVSYNGAAKELQDMHKQGDNPLWTNSMFGGMPAYQISVQYKGNKIGWVERMTQLFMSRPIGYFNALMIGFYLMMVLLEVNPWLSLIGAVAFGFTSNHLVLFEAGHMTKLRAIAQFAPIIAGILLVFRQKYLLGGVLFMVGLAIGIYANHIQMIYYLGMILAIYVLIEIIQHIKSNQFPALLKAGGVLSIGLALAVAASTSNLMTTYEYSKDTMRGAPILAKAENKVASSSSEVSGLDWEYAMQWSNGFLDVMASMIPGVVGGGSREKLAADSEVASFLRKTGQNIKEGPLYWGELPFTSGPVYLGGIMCFLFILGLFIVEGTVKWWLGFGVLLTLLMSMGKNFDLLNHFLFDYFPMYGKFRAPSSVTSVTAVLIPLLGILGLSHILQGKINKEAAIKKLLIATGIAGGVSLFFALVGPSMFDFSSQGDARYQNAGNFVSALVADRKSLMRMDGFRAFALIAITAGLVWAYLKDKIGQLILLGGLGLLVLFDMWSIGKRYLDADKFTNRSMTQGYTARPVDQQIFAAENINPENSTLNPIGRGGYRVYDASINTFNSSQTSYYHNTIGGYHAAKLQRFQDLIDYHISNGRQGVLNMLNTKYVIGQKGQLQSNSGALGTAWFVENIQKVNTPDEEIVALEKLNPATTAVVLDKEFSNYIGSFDPQKNGTISMVSYKPDNLNYTSNTNSEQLAVFSEIWYGPNKGWQAYIDGTPAEHIRVNYALRAMKIPAGQHQIEFKFQPAKFYTGETISLIASLLILLSLLGLIGYKVNQFVKGGGLEESLAEARVAAGKRVVKTTPTVSKLKPTLSKKKKRKPKK